jgi:Fe-S cluster assembly iron-binding protein IscA
MESVATLPVQFTQNAIIEVKRLMAEEGFDTNTKLRVGVKGGGFKSVR